MPVPDERNRPDPRTTLQKGDRLPALMLPLVEGPETVPLRHPARGATVLMILGSPAEEPEASYLSAVEKEIPDPGRWDARILVIDSGDGKKPLASASDRPLRTNAVWRQVRDPDRALRARVGIERDSFGLVIADRWGEIFHAAYARSADALTPASEILELLRFIATQCPECGVPDTPLKGRWEVGRG